MVTPLSTVRANHPDISTDDVAKAVGCDKSHYWRIETGQQVPSAALAAKIAAYFEGEITELEILYPERYPVEQTAGEAV